MHMRKFLFVVLAFICFTAWSQETETRSPGSFSGVKVAEGIDAYLKKGDKESIKVEVSNGSLSDVITEVSGSYLKIHMRENNRSRAHVKVYVTYVQVNKLSASSAGSIFSESTIKGNDMEISASSAGTIEVSLEASSVQVSASSAGDIELKGKTGSLTAESSSAGEIDAYELEAENVEADASSGASIKLNVTKSLEARASSGGSIRYRGNPDKSNTGSSSGGSVKKSS